MLQQTWGEGLRGACNEVAVGAGAVVGVAAVALACCSAGSGTVTAELAEARDVAAELAEKGLAR
eukprot:3237230-Alexandrium_andersonii.AAC.1